MAKAKSRAGGKGGGRGTSTAKRASKRPGARGKSSGKTAARGRAAGRAGARKPTPGKTSGRKSAARKPTMGSGKGTIGKSGEGLDGGVARRQAGDPAAVGTRPASARRPEPRKAKAQLPGEKAVADTDRTFPVAPERPAPGEAEPMPEVALDRRRHIVGTDDPGATGRT